MKIGICDDDVIWLKNAKGIIEAYCKSEGIEAEIFLFQDDEEIFRQNALLDMIYMDIELKNKNGIEVVAKMNQYNPGCFVVYLTNYMYFASDVYDTSHDYFVVKKQFSSKIDKIFELYRNKVKLNQNRISISLKDKSVITIPVNEIMYLERSERITYIITIKETYATKTKIEELDRQLMVYEFIRCHKSFMVNPYYVKVSSKDFFKIVDDTEILISQRYKKNSREKYLNWVSEHFI